MQAYASKILLLTFHFDIHTEVPRTEYEKPADEGLGEPIGVVVTAYGLSAIGKYTVPACGNSRPTGAGGSDSSGPSGLTC